MLKEQKNSSNSNSFSINHVNDLGNTPLHIACINGKINLVKMLLNKKSIDINFENEAGETPFYIACKNGHTEIVKELLKKDDINIGICNDKSNTPFYIACKNGHTEIVKELLKKVDTYINDYNASNATPLYAACKNGHTEIVKELLKKDDININGYNDSNATPLYAACKNGHIEIVKELLKKDNIDINKADKYLYTPLHIACVDKHVEVIEELLKKDDIDISAENMDNKTALLMACCYEVNSNKRTKEDRQKQVKIVKMLLDRSELTMEDGLELLYEADDNKELVELLFQNPKCDPEQYKDDDYNILLTSCESLNVDLVKFLLEDNRININYCAGKMSGLHFLIEAFNYNKDNKERLKEAKEIIKLLIKHGIDLNLTNEENLTALELAEKNNNNELVNTIKEYMSSENQTITGNKRKFTSDESENDENPAKKQKIAHEDNYQNLIADDGQNDDLDLMEILGDNLNDSDSE